MKTITQKKQIRCAIYTRKSVDEGLEKSFNSLDAQREAGEAYIADQRSLGWECLSCRYDDGGFSGANINHPALKKLLEDIKNEQIDCVVVYMWDRLIRRLADFFKLVEEFEKYGVSFISATQPINTLDSTGRLNLHVALSFAQFEREVTAERTKYKMSSSRRKGKWMGGRPELGYDIVPEGGRIVVNHAEATQVREIFKIYLECRSLQQTMHECNRRSWITKRWVSRRRGKKFGGIPFNKNTLYRILRSLTYVEKLRYEGKIYAGEHEAIVDESLWQDVQNIMNNNSPTSGTKARNRHEALLQGILWCESCGKNMIHSVHSKKNKQYRYYVCHTAQQSGWESCPTKSINAYAIEQDIIDHTKSICENFQLIASPLALREQRRVGDLERLYSEQKTLLSNIEQCKCNIEVHLRTEHSPKLPLLNDRLMDFEQQYSSIAFEIDSLEDEEITPDMIRQALHEYHSVWDELSLKEKTERLDIMLECVGYDGRTGIVTVTFHSAGLKEMRKSISSEKRAVGHKPSSIKTQFKFEPRIILERHKPLPEGRTPRVSKMVALALHLQGYKDRKEVKTYTELAKLGRVTRARMTQIMDLTMLSPDIQEEILFLPKIYKGRDKLNERVLRKIAAEPLWAKQRELWKQIQRADAVSA